jgi:hypothetical protein
VALSTIVKECQMFQLSTQLGKFESNMLHGSGSRRHCVNKLSTVINIKMYKCFGPAGFSQYSLVFAGRLRHTIASYHWGG